ncbi:MAG: aspartate carbamoyltransferase [Candidatus Bathyarchaeia archaeon]|nr:aspartate carbamoyltransferase [Candidatus Bathyarchaeota archaeon]
MRFLGRNVISIKDFTREDIEYILSIADSMEPIARKGSDLLKGKIMAALFFEPSTRTRLSFESAMKRLGGEVIGFSEAKGTSIEKGENLADTIRVVENYADLIVIRHPLEGAARLASEFSKVPIINAGSGAEEHPTQAMLDLYTIKKEKGTLDGLNIALVGDLRYGRTTHSLAYALALYNVNLFLVSPELLKMRREVVEDIQKKIPVKELNDLNEVLPILDVIYVTRIQEERFADPAEYAKVKNSYRLTAKDLDKAKKNVIVMHPLPRIDEVSFDVDKLPCAKYFKQVWYGLLLRMALLSAILGAVK